MVLDKEINMTSVPYRIGHPDYTAESSSNDRGVPEQATRNQALAR